MCWRNRKRRAAVLVAPAGGFIDLSSRRKPLLARVAAAYVLFLE